MRLKSVVPWSMVAFRSVLGPLAMVGVRCGWSGGALVAMVLGALLSDIFDGVLARRWKTDTAVLRLSDSLADTFFYVCVAGAIALEMPQVWRPCRGGVLVLLGCEALRFGFDFAKFGKPASYHSYLAKLWGLVLATAVIDAFATRRASVWMSAAILLGVLSNLETLAMSLVLPVWRRDVKTLAVAWTIRTRWMQQLAATGAAPGAAPGLALVLSLVLFGGVEARAQSLQHVTYVGGTALLSNGARGRISVSSTDAVEFLGSAKLVIPYDRVISYESKTLKKVQVGMFTEGIWRLLAPWPEAKQLSLSYRDAEEHPQVVVLEMSKGDERLLVEVLKTRVSSARAPQTIPLVRPPVAGRREEAGQ